MPELYQSLGFSSHPFSTFSAEEELTYLDKIFKTPRYFNALASDLKGGASRFIFGERGSGKTTLVYRLRENLNLGNIFTIIFDSFDGIEQTSNKTSLLNRIITELITVFAVSLVHDRKRLSKLERHDRQKLSAFIDIFFRTMSREEYLSISNSVTRFKRINAVKLAYNWLFSRSLNVAISGTVAVVSDLVTKSLGLEKVETTHFFKAYLPELNLTTPKYDHTIFDYPALKKIFLETTRIISKCGYHKTVVFLDKIDEFPEFQGNVSKIAGFIQELATDTTLLNAPTVGFVFSLWHRVRPKLNASGVRFDKFKPIDVSWTDDDLVSIIDLRLRYFASRSQVRFYNLVLDFKFREDIKSLANGSPRDFLRLLSYIYDEQTNSDIGKIYFDQSNIEQGILRFIREYDYYSLYPRVDSHDVLKLIGLILACKMKEFSSEQFSAAFDADPRLLNSQLQTLQAFGLIEDVGAFTDNTKYKVMDPKITYLISKSKTSLRYI